MSVSTQEQTNFARLSRVVIDLFPRVMRDLLTSFVNPNATPPMYFVNVSKSWTKAKKKILSAEQQQVVNNLSAARDYKACDNSLLYILVRNLTGGAIRPTNGWGKPVGMSSMNIGDDVERLRTMRNMLYGHTISADISSIDYANFVQEVNYVLTRFDSCHSGAYSTYSGIGTYAAELKLIEGELMDKKAHDVYTQELKNLAQHEKQMDKRLKDVEMEQDNAKKENEALKKRVDGLETETQNVKKEQESVELKTKSDEKRINVLETGQVARDEAMEKRVIKNEAMLANLMPARMSGASGLPEILLEVPFQGLCCRTYTYLFKSKVLNINGVESINVDDEDRSALINYRDQSPKFIIKQLNEIEKCARHTAKVNLTNLKFHLIINAVIMALFVALIVAHTQHYSTIQQWLSAFILIVGVLPILHKIFNEVERWAVINILHFVIISLSSIVVLQHCLLASFIVLLTNIMVFGWYKYRIKVEQWMEGHKLKPLFKSMTDHKLPEQVSGDVHEFQKRSQVKINVTSSDIFISVWDISRPKVENNAEDYEERNGENEDKRFIKWHSQNGFFYATNERAEVVTHEELQKWSSESNTWEIIDFQKFSKVHYCDNDKTRVVEMTGLDLKEEYRINATIEKRSDHRQRHLEMLWIYVI